MVEGHVAVIDIGKTNAKLALVDLANMSELAVITRPNTVLQSAPWPHFDVEGHWEFILQGLADYHRHYGVSAISVTTHGACVALLAADGSLVAPILDYEFTGPDMLADAYDAIRPPFSETGSPRLAMGLNVGAQLFWQFQVDPELKTRTKTIVTYPQYWGHRLTGVAATDVTSLGCHTDLWNPHTGQFSSLVADLDVADKLAAPRRPGEVLGTVLPDIAGRTGLAPNTRVFCGIHDSNASLLPHILGQQAPFSVVSTGTWVIAMSIGGQRVALDPNADTLVNVNALGNAVPSARFMGGREYDIATGRKNSPIPSETHMQTILEDGVMLLPAVVTESGPFRGRNARWIGPEPALGSPLRKAAVSFYLALVTSRCLKEVGHQGAIIVEGPFATNRAFLLMLSAVTKAPVKVSKNMTGTSQGAAMLVDPSDAAVSIETFEPLQPIALRNGMLSYAEKWLGVLKD
ncbi:MAG: FGGY-family carbohydrate kinase [Ruegeria sp.]|nr:FGGY-family carbohydrate kinase [Ruegeria sp.]